MTTFYLGQLAGQKYVLEGDNAGDWFNPYKRMVAIYSNWSLYSKHHVFNGAPDEYHTPGTGYHPHGLQMSRWFLGEDLGGQYALRGIGQWTPGVWAATYPQADGRFRPLQFHGVTTLWAILSPEGKADMDTGIFGHVLRFVDYSWNLNLFYFGAVPKALATNKLGHALRSIDANVAGVDGAPQPDGFGYFPPSLYKGLPGLDILNDTGLGENLPTNLDGTRNYLSPYGHNGVNVWQGIPSAKAL